MPKLKERSSDDKIKRPGKDRKPKGPLRQMTAKFRRRLVERQRDNSSTATPDTQAEYARYTQIPPRPRSHALKRSFSSRTSPA